MEEERGAMSHDRRKGEGLNQDLIEGDQNKGMVDSNSSRKEDGGYECNLCLYSSRDNYNMRLHLGGKHSMELDYRCPSCGSHFKTKVAFVLHKALSLHPTEQNKNSVAGEVKEDNTEDNNNKPGKLGTYEDGKYKMCPRCGNKIIRE